jgi:hypothetical protein
VVRLRLGHGKYAPAITKKLLDFSKLIRFSYCLIMGFSYNLRDATTYGASV